jgi:hypothetical protein
MHNLDNKRFVYYVLSQLNPEKWGGNKLEEKENDYNYYHNNKELQAYAQDMIDKDAKHNRGIILRRNDAYIGERGLNNVSIDYKRIILLFDTRPSSRRTIIYFPQEDINSLCIDEGMYNYPIKYFFKKNKNLNERINNSIMQKAIKTIQSNIINNNKITISTSINVILFSLLENYKVIALQIAFPFIIKSLLFSKLNEPGYENPEIMVKSKNSINLLLSGLNSNSTSNSISSIFSKFKTNIPNDEERIIEPPDYFKKKRIIEPKIRYITNDEERKKEEENLKQLKELYNKIEQKINNMKIENKERKKRINELESALLNKEPKLKPLPKEKSQKEIEEENELHIKAVNIFLVNLIMI